MAHATIVCLFASGTRGRGSPVGVNTDLILQFFRSPSWLSAARRCISSGGRESVTVDSIPKRSNYLTADCLISGTAAA